MDYWLWHGDSKVVPVLIKCFETTDSTLRVQYMMNNVLTPFRP